MELTRRNSRQHLIQQSLNQKATDYYKYSSDQLMNEFIITYPDLVTRAQCFPKASKEVNGKWRYSIDFYNYLSHNMTRNPIANN